ncbi:unnamed protein product [Anisakis simplex]|uniref:ZP domain-containing protein n=1 Tax=Anisakis simplex TaxID=6269 RepID=A0A3P6Q2Z4_ANISI|nr:unnamed protein product [Anisakis simplex]
MDIVTAQPFLGNIFVKGHSKDVECRRSFAINNTNSYALSLGNCGMQRLRSVNPRGINFVVTLIVSFHPNGFITKNDRAFHLNCFYMERNEILTAAIRVSELTSSVLSHEPVMPTCKYSVKRGSVNGPQVKFANIGETVFHVWECNGGGMGMLVKKCFVTDGEGEQHAVVDLYGYKSIVFHMSSSTLSENLRAMLWNHVFSIFLQPPNCKRHRERRQSVDTKLMNDERFEVDLVSPQMLIADVDEDVTRIDEQHSSNMNLLCTSQILIALLPFCVLTVIAIVCSIVRLVCDKHSSTESTKSSSSSFFCNCLSSCKPYLPA